MYFNIPFLPIVEQSLTLQGTLPGSKLQTIRELPIRVVEGTFSPSAVEASTSTQLRNEVSTGWTFMAMQDKNTVVLKAPPSLQTETLPPLVARVALATFLGWQALQDIATVSLRYVYNLTSECYELVWWPSTGTNHLKLVSAENLLHIDALVESDHGKVFKIIAPGESSLRTAVYLCKNGKASLYGLSQYMNADISRTGYNWLIRTTNTIDSQMADMLWAHCFAYELSYTTKVLSPVEAQEALPSLRADTLDATTLKALSKRHFTLAIDTYANRIKDLVAPIPLFRQPMPSVLRDDADFMEEWVLFQECTPAEHNPSTYFRFKINPKTRKYAVVLGLRYPMAGRTFSLPELTGPAFRQLLDEWFCQSGTHGLKVRIVEGVSDSVNCPASLMDLFTAKLLHM